MSTAFATDLQDYQRRGLAERVAAAIDAVRRRGDEALRDAAPARDPGRALVGGVATDDRLRLTAVEIDACVQAIAPIALDDLRLVQEQARLLAGAQRAAIADFETDGVCGSRLGIRHVPVQSVGICVPGGGAAPALSAVQAAALAARAAGVQRIVACIGVAAGCPPSWTLLVAALALAGVDEIYRVGGVRGLAALSFGTESILRADIALGLGDGAMDEAMGQLSCARRGDGATGILVIADDGADPELVAADLVAAGECGPQARGVLITTSPTLAARVATAVERQLRSLPGAKLSQQVWGRSRAIHVVRDCDAACALADRHGFACVEVMTAEPRWFLERLHRCTELFLGAGAGAALAGVLDRPAALRTACERGSLSVDAFLRVITYHETESGLAADGAAAFGRHRRVAGLEAHARACELRAAWQSRKDRQRAALAAPQLT